jgi:hypothetical protein
VLVWSGSRYAAALTLQPLNASTLKPLNASTIQQFNPSTLQRLTLFALAPLLLLLTACRTIAPPAPINLAEPGWAVREGQAVWRPNHHAAEIAGELLVAVHRDGRGFVQFTKTPFPFAVAQNTRDAWRIEFPMENKSFSGRGNPPARLIWLHLPACLEGRSLPKAWRYERETADRLWLHNPSRGESLDVYFTR